MQSPFTMAVTISARARAGQAVATSTKTLTSRRLIKPLFLASGFTAIEGVIAVFLLSFVGLVVGLTFLRTSVSAINTRQAQRATALAAMVSEQYAAYAAHDYANLADYDQRNSAPQAFFGTKDDLGFDNLRIT